MIKSMIKKVFKSLHLYLKDKKLYLRNLYAQDLILNNIRSQGGEIEKPFMPFDSEKLLFTPPIYIGPYCHLYLRANLVIGKGTIIGPRFTVHSANHRYEGNMVPYDDVYEAKNIIIGKNVWIGSDVMVLPGVTIGDGAIVGAGSVIAKDVPNCAIVCGNPCKVVKFRDINRYDQLVKSQKIYLELKALGKTETDESKRIKILCKD